MTTLMYFIIFIIVLFLYIHITAHYKKSEDLEIYEADYTTAKQIQEICDIKQPVLFDIKSVCPEIPLNLEEIKDVSEKSNYEIHIKDATDIRNNPDVAGESILLPFCSGYGLIESDQKSRYFSENNTEFAADIFPKMVEKCDIDELLKPSFIAQTKYDLLFGSDKSYTACRYHTEYEKFLLVKTGKIQVKMTPWKSRKYMHVESDYINYEFRSPIDIWNPQEQFKRDIDNIKFLEFEVINGFVLYVPPFWFYSIRFISEESKPAMIESYTYNSIMNIASNLPQWAMYYLQQSNTNTKVLPKKIETEILEKEDENSQDEGEPDTPKKSEIDALADFKM